MVVGLYITGRMSNGHSLGHGFKSFGQGRVEHFDWQRPMDWSSCPKENGVPLPERGGCRLAQHKRWLSAKLVNIVMCPLELVEEVVKRVVVT